MDMEYELIATLGPASSTESIWQAMLDSGVTGFRLNTSHLTLAQLQTWLERLDLFLTPGEPRPPVILDLQGSKWRLGDFEPFTLEEGQLVELALAPSAGRSGVLPVPHPDFFQAALLSGGEILLNDAKVQLVVEETGSGRLQARVSRGGEIAPKKGLTFASSSFRKESLGAKDEAILEGTRLFPSVRYAVSYVRDALEMARYRSLFGGAWLIAKLERPAAVDQARQVAGSADALWLCRGDLGAELGLPAMAEAVHRFSRRLGDFHLPVLLAGQVFEHMTGVPAPTRSEVCSLYDALQYGYHGFVLSDETATGRYPVESCRAAAMFKDRVLPTR